MKAVMLSIQPKWCEKIASGKKTVEVRKTRPKIETPFKCFIYCTLPPKEELFTHGCIREYANGCCNHFGYHTYSPDVDEDDFCSYGERRANG